jgi:hypothetical protein
MTRRRVIIESPYRQGEVTANIAYAKAALRDSLQRGEAPIASHLLFTQPGILDDSVPEERRLGIEAGLSWYQGAQACVVYCDFGTSDGMLEGIRRAGIHGIPVEKRTLRAEEAA